VADRGPGGSASEVASSASAPPESLTAAVVADAARRWGVGTESTDVVTAVARTWPDGRLGALPDRRATDVRPVSGWQIVVRAGERTATYHTDGSQRFVRCADGRRRGPAT
jgi:hypothetical protein